MDLLTRYTNTVHSRDRTVDPTLRILGRILGGEAHEGAVRLWDGTFVATTPEPLFTLVLTHPGALRRMLVPPTDLAMGEAFVRGDFDVEGDLEAAIATVARAAARLSTRDWLTLSAQALSLPTMRSPRPALPRARLRGPLHTRVRDRMAVRHHYDVGNEFFALWLDKRMVYSCAYFRTGTEDLDTAQEDKLELICRKLRLRPGERLLDIGCGWGGLIMYAAERFGADATGVTLSEPQARWAQQHIIAAGLQNRCRAEVCDYREVTGGPFDKIVSVGMFEHVGRTRLPEYFAKALTLLRPGGLFLNHGIAERPERPVWRRLVRRRSYVNAHVFPDGELVPVGETLAAAEAAGFEVRDVEGLREHYMRTLRLWRERLEARAAEAIALGEGHYRSWRLFTAAFAYGFATGRTGVFQALLARPTASGAVALPWTRVDIYEGPRPQPGGGAMA